MKYIALTLSTLCLFLLATPAQAETTTNCQPIYGGGETCQTNNTVSINKKILRSELTFKQGQSYQNSDFVDHITTKNKPYSPNHQTAFRLYVTNISTKEITNVTVEDLLPPRYITFVAGQGKYDSKTRTFSTTIEKLKPNETKEITVQVMTARLEDLPQGSGLLCTLNQARATTGSNTSEDNSQLCMNRTGVTPSPFPNVQGTQTTPQVTPQPTTGTSPTQTKGGLPIEQTPQTQTTPETGAEHLVLLAPLAGAGYFLRKKTSLK